MGNSGTVQPGLRSSVLAGALLSSELSFSPSGPVSWLHLDVPSPRDLSSLTHKEHVGLSRRQAHAGVGAPGGPAPRLGGFCVVG